ncbi:hypothetical protein BO70DRAFT_427167 [Aspergillus heteromorphus CBS 117.55]|uniref:Uncharacterized protein n=1 Tax=Aspergillus heteromorphus CBS 117.55 TaxID=1448321 RepID=A0A317WTX3_9EURO|nr:uncharacterized protein BO70DRAFT_427167 [Aspergillus heteromorphus CBS 117.55]PWY88388.1 hypothetical protein BO70DRAFT_427167 [Aspergillus heteromorphus CBS 117.55]
MDTSRALEQPLLQFLKTTAIVPVSPLEYYQNKQSSSLIHNMANLMIIILTFWLSATGLMASPTPRPDENTFDAVAEPENCCL